MMAELLDLSKHNASKTIAEIHAEMSGDRLQHWQKYALDGVHLPFAFPPCLRFADATIEEQVTAVFSEARELADALADPELSTNGQWLVELLDLHHAMETLYRILTNLYGPEVLNAARLMCIEKNAVRGYYQAPEVVD